jgi:CYTH domain-containing protein/CHAD domain-containing protein
MGYVIEPSDSTQGEIRRVARERLDDAIGHLDAVIAGEPGVDIESAVHEVRKRCKEMRGLARLVRSDLGDEFTPFEQLVKGAASQLSALRDAHAVLATFDRLLDAHPDEVDVQSVRDRQAEASAAATAAIEGGDERILKARALLIQACEHSADWTMPRGFAPLGDGLAVTYARGRRGLRRAEQLPTNYRFHQLRKAVKYLWYQTRLLHDAAPSVLGPLVDQLDGLADALGDDHDLAVLVDLLDAEPDRFGTPGCVVHVRQLATRQQDELRVAAYRSGATIYAEPTSAFRRRIRSYWRLAVDEGPERPTGGIATLAAARSERSRASASTDSDTAVTVERERKFLIDAIPTDLDLSDRVDIRQGYLLADDSASVRVRDSGHHGRTLTVKAGQGAERTELEWAIGPEQFAAAWPHTVGRRVVKTRHRIPHGTHRIELDVFAEDLDGLVVAEVEFDSTEALTEFEPPAWFGREVTDDGRFTNASLSLHGRPDQSRFDASHPQ